MGLVVVESWVLPEGVVGVELGLAQVSLQDLYACLSTLQDLRGQAQIQSMVWMLSPEEVVTEETGDATLTSTSMLTLTSALEGRLKALASPFLRLQMMVHHWVPLRRPQVWSLVLLALGLWLVWVAMAMAPFVDTAVGTLPGTGLTLVLEWALHTLVNAVGR